MECLIIRMRISFGGNMAQKGILSFFNKPASGGKSKAGSGRKRRLVQGDREGEEEEEEGRGREDQGPVTSASDSPVFKRKSKRRRVVIDSDDEDSGVSGDRSMCEGGDGGDRSVCEGGDGGDRSVCEGGDGGDRSICEGGDGLNGHKEEVVKEKGQDLCEADSSNGDSSKDASTRIPTSPLKPEQPMEVSTGITQTPPKRATARKHTGKRQQSRTAKKRIPAKPAQPPVTSPAKTMKPKAKSKDDDGSRKSPTKARGPSKNPVRVGSSGEGGEGGEGGVGKGEGSAAQHQDGERGGADVTEEPVAMESVCEAGDPPSDDVTSPKTTEKSRTGTPGTKKPMHSFFAAKTSQKASSKSTKKETPTTKDKPQSSRSPTAAVAVSSTGAASGSEADYNPARSGYHPLEHACWERGQRVPYLAIAKTFEKIEEESKRLKIVSTLTNLFRSVILISPGELVECVYLCLNKLAPAYEGLELGIGESLLMKAIAGATGRQVQQIKAESIKKGDLGIVAEASRSTQRVMFAPPKLTVSAVFAKLKEIAAMSGTSSMNKKVELIKGLFIACRQSEARYLIRSLGGKLRIGLAEQSVLTAIGHAVAFSPPGQEWPPEVVDASSNTSGEKFHKMLEEAALQIKTSYCEHPNYDTLTSALIEHGVGELSQHCRLTPGIPLKPMLAHPTKGVNEVLKRFENAEFSCEWKYDGERAQIHVLEGGETSIYSRNSENNTSKYPDIIARMPKVLKESVKSCVIDAEAVAWDTEKQQILPFQILSTRKRKDAEIAEIKVQVCLFAFDLIYLNGRSLVQETFKTRRALLQESFNVVEGEFVFAKSMDSTDVEDIQEFMEESIKGNCEGLMVKTLEKDATYEIARRSHNWLKLKKDYLEGVGDTLDLVVIGGFHGTGKRTGRYGGYLLACYDEENEEYQVICKIGTGFKDEQLEQHTDFLKSHIIDSPRPYYRYSDGVKPDHWFDAVQVWEVKAADLSISPVYTAAAGIVDPEKGISLRFPRFLRIREDKKPEEATSSEQIATMYRSQQNIPSKGKGGESHDPDDFY